MAGSGTRGKSGGKAGDKDRGKAGDKRGRNGRKALAADAATTFGLENRQSGARSSDVNPAVYVADSELHGLGMFATHRIEANLSLGRLAGMPTYEDGIYVLWLDDELGLEVTNDFRFINHGRPANCELTAIDVVTLRELAPDEELLHDYGW